MNSDVLAERYRICQNTNSDMGYHMPSLRRAVLDTNACRVIELGVRYGCSTIAWLSVLEELQGLYTIPAHLWSVDCSFPIEDPETGIELLNPQGPLGVVDYWTFILGYDTWPAVLAALPIDVDVVMIDTNHVYEETVVELELYAPRVRKGGLILLHDTALEETSNAVTPQPPFPVRTAMVEFCEKHDKAYTNDEHSYGLGTIYI